MSWSATEIATLAAKAARGGGAPPEQAARFGQVAAAHLTAGRDPCTLAAALDALPAGPILTLPLAIAQALTVRDVATSVSLQKVALGDLLLGYVETLPFEANLNMGADGRPCLTVLLDHPRIRPVPTRITGCDVLVDQMTGLAENTLVPESESSRLSGAGAGLTDND